MTVPEIAQLVASLTLIGGVVIALLRMPTELKQLRAATAGGVAVAGKTEAEKDAIAEATIGRMTDRISGMQDKQLDQGYKTLELKEQLSQQRIELNGIRNELSEARQLNVEQAKIIAQQALVITDQAKVVADQRRLLDGIPDRMRLYDGALLKLGIELPPDPIFEAARAAVDRIDTASQAGSAPPAQAVATHTVDVEAPAIINVTEKPEAKE